MGCRSSASSATSTIPTGSSGCAASRTWQNARASLAAFYGGPVWKAHSAAANATMIDSDDVLLLRPARPHSGFVLDGERNGGGGFVMACVLPEAPDVVRVFEETVAPSVTANGGVVLGYFESEPSENTFPSLPVREGEHVFVWFAGFADRDSLERAARNVEHAQVLRLAPTSRSLLPDNEPSTTSTSSSASGGSRTASSRTRSRRDRTGSSSRRRSR